MNNIAYQELEENKAFQKMAGLHPVLGDFFFKSLFNHKEELGIEFKQYNFGGIEIYKEIPEQEKNEHLQNIKYEELKNIGKSIFSFIKQEKENYDFVLTKSQKEIEENYQSLKERQIVFLSELEMIRAFKKEEDKTANLKDKIIQFWQKDYLDKYHKPLTIEQGKEALNLMEKFIDIGVEEYPLKDLNIELTKEEKSILIKSFNHYFNEKMNEDLEKMKQSEYLPNAEKTLNQLNVSSKIINMNKFSELLNNDVENHLPTLINQITDFAYLINRDLKKEEALNLNLERNQKEESKRKFKM